MSFIRRRIAPVAGLLWILSACSDSPTTVTESTLNAAPSAAVLQTMRCTVDANAGSMDCVPADAQSPRGVAADLIFGGQNTHVKLTSTNVVNNGTTVTADVTVQNMMSMPMATTNGTTASANGVRVFFSQGPSNGVTVANADGTAAFTAAGQKFFQYTGTALGADGILATNEVSTAKSWQFNLNGQSSFTFTVFLSTALPAEQGILRWTTMVTPPTQTGNKIWAASATDVFATENATNHAILHWNGAAWDTIIAATPNAAYIGIHGTSASDVWFVGGTNIRHYTGSGTAALSASNTTNSLRGVFAVSSNSVYAVGTAGTIDHFASGTWTVLTSPVITQLNSVWAASDNDVFIVGNAGVIIRCVALTCSSMTSPTGNSLNTVWGFSATDVYAAGNSGTIVHYDGTNWSTMSAPSGYTAQINDISGTSSSNLRTVAGNGTILRFNGSNWFQMSSNGATTLTGVASISATEAIAVGQSQTYRHGIR